MHRRVSRLPVALSFLVVLAPPCWHLAHAQTSAAKPKPLEVIENSIGMKLVLVPAGEFDMGSPESETGRDITETRHHVRLTHDFFLGQQELTQAQYERVTGRNPSWFSRKGQGKDRVARMNLDTRAFPVEQVTWEEASEFCRRLSALAAEKAAGREYRLPTEAEWEYACRGGQSAVFSCGESLDSTQANFDGNYPYGSAEKGSYLARPTKVGSYQANAFGLFDMHGNVWEWCADSFGDYPGGAVVDPLGPNSGADRVFRGGGWYGSASNCRSAFRERYTASYRDFGIGFRVAASLPQRPGPP